MDTEQLLAGLNAEQIAAVTADGGPIVCVAGAGAGKTRVLTRRIARRVIQAETDPQRVLVATFTNKAATELRHRITALGLRDDITAGTFHSLALAQLKQRWDERRQNHPHLLESKASFIRKNMPKQFSPHINELVTEFNWSAAQMISFEHYEEMAKLNHRKASLRFDQISELYSEYQKIKKRKRVIDFEDLLYLAIRDLNEDEHYRDAVQWRHRHFLVDEFQDINPLQFELLTQWRGDRDDLFIVGDPNQSIYGWNGADPNLLTDFCDREPNSKLIRLTTNYRSSPEILCAANSVLPKGQQSITQTTNPGGSKPKIYRLDSDQAEATYVANQIAAKINHGQSADDFAILARTQAQLETIHNALRASYIPAQISRGAEVEALSLLRQLLKSRRLQDVSSLENELERLETTPEVEGLQMNLEKFQEQTPNPNLDGFSAWLRQNAEPVSCVTLTTFHGCKGLEWNHVFVCGLEDGFVPISYATTDDQLAEEQRLLYVAMTRAKKELTVTWAGNRTFGNNEVDRQPSKYLRLIKQATDSIKAPVIHAHNWKQSINNVRDGLKSESTRENNFCSRLLEWRSEKARIAKVPESAIMHDNVLYDLASQAPISIDSLSEIKGLRSSSIERYGSEILELAETS